MNYEHIETFLAVVNEGSINSAAEHLYVSQSTVSTRIQQLEEELGTQLIMRQRGKRTLALTAHGKAFVPIAHQWVSLRESTLALKDQPAYQDLAAASVDAVNSFTFAELFRKIISDHPEIKLRIQTHHSDEIHGLIANHICDIGFVFSRVQYPDVISRPVYRELMYLICHKDSRYYDSISAEELDPSKEIYLEWDEDFRQWHDRYFGGDTKYLLRVNTGSLLQNYLDIPDRWAVAPMSVIQECRHRSDLVYYRLSDPPSPRICYELTHRYPRPSCEQALQSFREELHQYILASKEVCMFEPWMLDDQ